MTYMYLSHTQFVYPQKYIVLDKVQYLILVIIIINNWWTGHHGNQVTQSGEQIQQTNKKLPLSEIENLVNDNLLI